MSGTRPVQWLAERLIRSACGRLPADERAERFREWTAELHAILDDESIRPSWLRGLRALAFCVGIARATRQLSRLAPGSPGRPGSSRWRSGAAQARTNGTAARLAVGVGVYAVVVASVIAVLRLYPGPRGWPFLVLVTLAIGFDGYCLADIARSSEVRYLPKWGWALVCLAQTPAGGIAYLCAGRVGRTRPAPPGPARQP